MNRTLRRAERWGVLALVLGLGAVPALAARLTMKDGRTIDGAIAQLSSMAENPAAQQANPAAVQSIVFVDDNLRRTFVAKRQIQAADQGIVGEAEERLRFRQPVPRNGGRLGIVGPILQATPFDEYGRRYVKMNTGQGLLPIIQGITELTPHWVKLESLQMEGKPILWDMRLATTSIPLADLEKLLNKITDPKKLDERLRVVRFYLQAERYKDAEEKLKSVIKDFPDSKDQFQPILVKLHQGYARQILREMQVRRDAGQHELAYAMLDKFPTENVAGETLQTVRQLLEEYQGLLKRHAEVLERFDADLKLIKESPFRAMLEQFREELRKELSLDSLDRMAAYRQFWDDKALQAEDRLGLCVSGWLVGTADATRKLPVAISMYATRDLVRRYLTETQKLKQEEILALMKLQEGASPKYVARLLAQMKPPLPPGTAVKDTPGQYQHEIEPIAGEPAATYVVQLPPGYDPHRRYPTIVTLHGFGTTPAQQIDWWAGPQKEDPEPKNRLRGGQATRHGYIVVAPAWARPQQRTYGYSAEEHAIVLGSLRDACRRYAIDTDRVFLSGHSMGGDAAWDIGLAHPDLWAGMMPIAAAVDRYVGRYWENMEYVPFYLVSGENDADYAIRNAADLDRYFKHGYNATVVQYQGRGHEHYYEEIVRLFDWMGRYKRNFFPKEFTTYTMREFDNYFWWLELSDFPARSMVSPESWPPARGTLAAKTEATLTEKNGITVRTAAASAIVWLAPEMVNFGKPIQIMVNGQKLRTGLYVTPDVAVMLEDARTRADRMHVFWAKAELRGGRLSASN